MPSSARSLATLHLALLSLLSAFLLFQVQPVISKFILPWFGGSPGVWTTCMLFFQLVLFLGYAYAHAVTLLPRNWQWRVHGALVLIALIWLPIAPSDSWKPTGSEDPAGRILLLLLATVGLPYFVMSSTSPLVQVWFTRATGGGNPWRLYALSNIGSLAALVSYPFFIEPRWDVLQQTWMWSAGFLGFAGFSMVGLWRDRNHHAAILARQESAPEARADDKDVAPPWWHRILWLLLPALGSLLLLGATNHVCQDVAVIPFLWVAPLSLYLLTFIICFEHERWYQPLPWGLLALAALFIGIGYHDIPADLRDMGWVKDLAERFHFKSQLVDLKLAPTFKAELLLCFSAMFLGIMVCHGELTRMKPGHRHLTEFYLWMSAGGALGGLFVSLLAPRLFTTYVEWPLGLMAAFVVATFAVARIFIRLRRRLWQIALTIAIFGVCIAALRPMKRWGFTLEDRIERARNFYGAISVFQGWDDEFEEEYRQLYHGGIIHGLQNMGPEDREVPVSYYGTHTGIGRALQRLKERPGAKVGIVGMGTATAACYGMKGHTYRFYEINPEIVRIARSQFTYLSDMERRGGKVEVVMGDARLNMQREDSQQFDVLLLDAFSGDSVPVHLLTLEAFEIYKRHMKADGIIAVHCTNRYLNLASVAEKAAREIGMRTTRIGTDASGDHDITDYVLLTNDEGFLQANPPESPWELVTFEIPPWTDKRHNLFEILDKE